jgi:hypothetical protein
VSLSQTSPGRIEIAGGYGSHALPAVRRNSGLLEHRLTAEPVLIFTLAASLYDDGHKRQPRTLTAVCCCHPARGASLGGLGGRAMITIGCALGLEKRRVVEHMRGPAVAVRRVISTAHRFQPAVRRFAVAGSSLQMQRAAPQLPLVVGGRDGS